MNKNVSVVGVPLDLGAENLGVDIGPNAFRYAKIIEKLAHVGFHVTDIGNISTQHRDSIPMGNHTLKYLDEIVRVSNESAQKIETLLKKGERVVGLGGDHSITLGFVSGASVALSGDIGLIYLDAHGDMNTDKTTMTGNIHGMHLASLLGFGASDLTNILNSSVKIKKEYLLHIGANDLDEQEKHLIRSEGLNCYMLFDVLAHGLGPLFERIDELAKKVKTIWVSMDLDVIDMIYAPGTGMPSRAGLSYREITTIASYVGQKCNVIGVDVVEFNPLQDIEGKTAELGIELIAKFLGGNYSWYTNYMAKNALK